MLTSVIHWFSTLYYSFLLLFFVYLFNSVFIRLKLLLLNFSDFNFRGFFYSHLIKLFLRPYKRWGSKCHSNPFQAVKLEQLLDQKILHHFANCLFFTRFPFFDVLLLLSVQTPVKHLPNVEISFVKSHISPLNLGQLYENSIQS